MLMGVPNSASDNHVSALGCLSVPSYNLCLPHYSLDTPYLSLPGCFISPCTVIWPPCCSLITPIICNYIQPTPYLSSCPSVCPSYLSLSLPVGGCQSLSLSLFPCLCVSIPPSPCLNLCSAVYPSRRPLLTLNITLRLPILSLSPSSLIPARCTWCGAGLHTLPIFNTAAQAA